MIATDKHGMKHEILLPTPERMLESIQRQRKFEEAVEYALPFLREYAETLEGMGDDIHESCILNAISDLEEYLP